jgi:hypothetical protein
MARREACSHSIGGTYCAYRCTLLIAAFVMNDVNRILKTETVELLKSFNTHMFSHPDFRVNVISAMLFALTAPFNKDIYRMADPSQPNMGMAVFGVCFFVVTIWINFSHALHVKQMRGREGTSEGVIAVVLIFLSMFHYFLIFYSFPKYASLSNAASEIFSLLLFGLVMLLMGFEMYLYFSKRTSFPLLIKNATVARSAYIFLVCFTIWFVWDIQVIAGPQMHRTSIVDIIIAYIITYSCTVVTFKRYLKIESAKLVTGRMQRILNFVSFILAYVVMLFSGGLIK